MMGNPDDPFNLAAEFQSLPDGATPSAVSSNLTEPKPGEPLSAEAEAALRDLPGAVGDEPEADGGEPGEDPASLMPSISFSEVKTRKYLVETFDWLAERFDSGHWKLTENQADMLAGPTAELLGGVWTKLSVILPDALVSVPGATAFLLAASWVVVPKAAQQMAISKARRAGQNTQPRRPGPVAVPRRPAPAHPGDGPPPEATIGNDTDFHVTGD